MLQIKAPNNVPKEYQDKVSVFLAGAIDMGSAEDWQSKVVEYLNDEDVLILNPRRDDWDSSWKQVPEDSQFNQQVTWELEHQEQADINVFVFTPESKAPITLLELGLFCKDKTSIVYCPKEFYRYGNVAMVCERYDIPLYTNFDKFLKCLKIMTVLKS